VVARPEKTDKLDKKGKPVIAWQEPRTIDGTDIPEDEAGLDIGPKTIQRYTEAIRGAKTILWNGPMGMFEDPRFAEGTFAVAKAVAEATQQVAPRASSAAATASKPSTRADWPTRSPSPARAAAPASSFSKARNCPAWRRSPTSNSPPPDP
jgi:hypothetical protein